MVSSSQTLIPFPADVIGTGLIYRSAIPGPSSLEKIEKQLKIHTIVQLCFDREFNEYGSPETLKLYASKNFQVIKFCIPDFKVPASVPETWELVDRIIGLTREGKNVLVHCVGGRGRTGLILALVAMKSLGYEPKQAVQWLRKYIPGAVESDVQERFLVTCHEELKRNQQQESHLANPEPDDSTASQGDDHVPMPQLLGAPANTLADLLAEESGSADTSTQGASAGDEAPFALVPSPAYLALASATGSKAEGEMEALDKQEADGIKSGESETVAVELPASREASDPLANGTGILSTRAFEEDQEKEDIAFDPVQRVDIESQKKTKRKCKPVFTCCILQ